MKGNVSEWTSTSRDEIAGVEIKPDKQKSSFVVKGGGWNSTPFYLQAGICQFFPVDAAHSFVGFRYVVHIKKK
jgi:formylglycine-generating enzyme required for sulfatase activity